MVEDPHETRVHFLIAPGSSQVVQKTRPANNDTKFPAGPAAENTV